jgi:hypothetical protein
MILPALLVQRQTDCHRVHTRGLETIVRSSQQVHLVTMPLETTNRRHQVNTELHRWEEHHGVNQYWASRLDAAAGFQFRSW